MLLHHLLEDAVSHYLESTYIVTEQAAWTYEEFFAATIAVANFINNLNIKRGDRVVVSLDNRVEAFQMVLGSITAGAIAVPLAPTLPSSKLQYILDNCQPSIFCGGRSLNILHDTKVPNSLRNVIAIQPATKEQSPHISVHDFKEVMSAGGAVERRHPVIDLDPAMIVYTSGSTGTPKGIVCNHLNIVSATRSIASYLGLSHEDKIIDFQPLFFDYGLYQAFLAAFTGASLYLEPNFMYPSETLDRIEREKITVVPFVPTNLATLFSQRSVSDRPPLRSVRVVTNTGAPFPTHLINSIRSLFPNAAIFSMYGLTECKRVSYLPPDQIDVKPNSVGIQMPNTEVWLVNEQDQRIGVNNVGELVVRGSNVTLGYWEDPEGSAKTFRVQPNGERWLYTGDYFKRDSDGYLYFVGRTDDLIKVGGYRTSTKEIEKTIAQLDFVQEVAAVSIADEQLGNSTKVFLVLKSTRSLSEKQIRQYFQGAFESSTLVPKIIEVISELPRTQSGKIDYKSIAK